MVVFMCLGCGYYVYVCVLVLYDGEVLNMVFGVFLVVGGGASRVAFVSVRRSWIFFTRVVMGFVWFCL